MDCLGPSGAIVLQPGASQAVALSAGAIREPRSPLGATSEEHRGGHDVRAEVPDRPVGVTREVTRT